MASIKLTGSLVVLLDDVDWPLVEKHHWYPAWSNGIYYAMAEQTPIQNPRVKFKMHQLILGFPADFIDHRNRDGLDNRRENLRLSTSSQNKANGRRYDCGSSGKYKGVYFKSSALQNRYRAAIRVENVLLSLGCFSTAKKAAEAYNRAALQHFGDFAQLNVVVP